VSRLDFDISICTKCIVIDSDNVKSSGNERVMLLLQAYLTQKRASELTMRELGKCYKVVEMMRFQSSRFNDEEADAKRTNDEEGGGIGEEHLRKRTNHTHLYSPSTFAFPRSTSHSYCSVFLRSVVFLPYCYSRSVPTSATSTKRSTASRASSATSLLTVSGSAMRASTYRLVERGDVTSQSSRMSLRMESRVLLGALSPSFG
jgi:hypothetical protein